MNKKYFKKGDIAYAFDKFGLNIRIQKIKISFAHPSLDWINAILLENIIIGGKLIYTKLDIDNYIEKIMAWPIKILYTKKAFKKKLFKESHDIINTTFVSKGYSV